MNIDAENVVSWQRKGGFAVRDAAGKCELMILCIKKMPTEPKQKERPAVKISEMTDEQLTQAIAVEVMGWKKMQIPKYDIERVICSPHEPKLDVDVWDAGIEGLWAMCEFEPLHDHNHAALPRQKMRSEGYVRETEDYNSGQHTRFIWRKGDDDEILGMMHASTGLELRAEACAMLQAKRSERKGK